MSPVDLLIVQLQHLRGAGEGGVIPVSQAMHNSRSGASGPRCSSSAAITDSGNAIESSALSIGMPSMVSSSENTPVTKALWHSSPGSRHSAASSSISRPRTTASGPTAGAMPPAREV